MTVKNPVVSVIVPVYKAEKYLHRCVDSLLNQTFPDFEILLIDDGSPDGSGALCDEYAKQDKRVQAYHKANGGVSSARQFGLEHATGVYVIHADPDDWVEQDMLECLVCEAKATNADMVLCDFFIETAEHQKYHVQKPSGLEPDVVFGDLLFQQLHGSCCNKLVRRVCYNKYQIRFPEGINYCEDLYVICHLLMHPIRISYLNRAFYHYDQVINPSSITRKSSLSDVAGFIKFADSILTYIESDKYAEHRYKLKSTAKEVVFRAASQGAKYKKVRELFSEINKRYVRDMFKRPRPLNVSVAVAISISESLSYGIFHVLDATFNVLCKLKNSLRNKNR